MTCCISRFEEPTVKYVGSKKCCILAASLYVTIIAEVGAFAPGPPFAM